MTDAITVDKLGHAYVADTWVFRSLDLRVPRGDVVAVLGRNASGKTTLLKILAGILTPREGSVRVTSTPAFVPQFFTLSFDYQVLDVVLMGRARQVALFAQPTWRDVAAAEAALERCGIADLSNRRVHELSGGQRQLVLFARALASEANVLVLDEPTSALDLGRQAQALEWIARLSRDQQLTVAFSTHHPHHALAVAHHTLLMGPRGTGIAGRTSDLLTEERLQQVYGVEVRRIRLEHHGKQVETLVPML